MMDVSQHLKGLADAENYCVVSGHDIERRAATQGRSAVS